MNHAQLLDATKCSSLVFVLTQLHFDQCSILFAKFDYPAPCRNFSFLTFVHDCETVAYCKNYIKWVFCLDN